MTTVLEVAFQSEERRDACRYRAEDRPVWSPKKRHGWGRQDYSRFMRDPAYPHRADEHSSKPPPPFSCA